MKKNIRNKGVFMQHPTWKTSPLCRHSNFINSESTDGHEHTHPVSVIPRLLSWQRGCRTHDRKTTGALRGVHETTQRSVRYHMKKNQSVFTAPLTPSYIINMEQQKKQQTSLTQNTYSNILFPICVLCLYIKRSIERATGIDGRQPPHPFDPHQH